MITKEQMLQTLEETDRDLANWPDPMGWLAEKRKVLRAIRSLIESSGEKACGAVEEAMVPAIELLVNHYLQESLAYGNSIHAKSYKAAIAVIKEALLAGAIAIMDRQNEAALSKPAPLPKEVEEAMADMDELALRSGNFRQRSALAVIKAALQPKVVSREELAAWIEYSGTGLMSWRVEFIADKLRKRGIEVRP